MLYTFMFTITTQTYIICTVSKHTHSITRVEADLCHGGSGSGQSDID